MDHSTLVRVLREAYHSGYLAGWVDGISGNIDPAPTEEDESMLQTLARDAINGRLTPAEPRAILIPRTG